MSDRPDLKLIRLYNRKIQRFLPDKKIFFIGFNKTATVSLAILMNRSGIRCVHWTENGQVGSPNIAEEVERRLFDDRELSAYLGRWTAFTDLTGGTGSSTDGNRHFRRFDEVFPNAFFVLNDRDTEAWIRSRTAHEGGILVREAAERLGVSEADVPDIWGADKERHVADVLAYFRGRKRFLHFRIDADSPSILTRFFWPTFFVSTSRWPHANKTFPTRMVSSAAKNWRSTEQPL
jgi:hypothetical protein